MTDRNPNLEPFIDEGYKQAFGTTRFGAQAEGICVHCKLAPTIYTEAGLREYRISGMCEKCFDGLFGDE